MKKFGKGFFAGLAIAAGATVASIIAIKKKVIDPINKKESLIEENRKKAARKKITR